VVARGELSRRPVPKLSRLHTASRRDLNHARKSTDMPLRRWLGREVEMRTEEWGRQNLQVKGWPGKLRGDGSPTPVQDDWRATGPAATCKGGEEQTLPWLSHRREDPLVLVRRDLPRVVQTGGKQEGKGRVAVESSGGWHQSTRGRRRNRHEIYLFKTDEPGNTNAGIWGDRRQAQRALTNGAASSQAVSGGAGKGWRSGSETHNRGVQGGQHLGSN
jgi:hypothetical protein